MADDILNNHNKLEEIRYSHNIEAPSVHTTTLAFNRFKLEFPAETLENAIGHVFFTKPELNIFKKYSNAGSWNDQIANNYHFADLLKTDPELFRCLQDNQGGGPFIYPLCNGVTNFPITDEIIKTRDSAETANDWKIVMAHRINDSRAANTIDFTFKDDRNLNIYKTLKIWVNYMHLITVGLIEPESTNRLEKTLDYAGSVYFFLTSEDGTNILYYCKLIGLFPTNIPSSAFSWDAGNFKQLEYNVTFQYSFKDESPLVIKDFNNVSGEYNEFIPSYLQNYGLAPSTWCKGVFIEEKDGRYKLRYSK